MLTFPLAVEINQKLSQRSSKPPALKLEVWIGLEFRMNSSTAEKFGNAKVGLNNIVDTYLSIYSNKDWCKQNRPGLAPGLLFS